MLNDAQSATPASAAQRKRQLIAQGRAYRAQVINSRNSAQAGLSPDFLAKGAIGQIAGAFSALRNGAPASLAGIDLTMVLPIVTAGWTMLSKRSLLKPVAKGVMVLGAAAAVAALVIKVKNARRG